MPGVSAKELCYNVCVRVASLSGLAEGWGLMRRAPAQSARAGNNGRALAVMALAHAFHWARGALIVHGAKDNHCHPRETPGQQGRGFAERVSKILLYTLQRDPPTHVPPAKSDVRLVTRRNKGSIYNIMGMNAISAVKKQRVSVARALSNDDHERLSSARVVD